MVLHLNNHGWIAMTLEDHIMAPTVARCLMRPATSRYAAFSDTTKTRSAFGPVGFDALFVGNTISAIVGRFFCFVHKA